MTESRTPSGQSLRFTLRRTGSGRIKCTQFYTTGIRGSVTRWSIRPEFN